jgi:hypothetical protein
VAHTENSRRVTGAIRGLWRHRDQTTRNRPGHDLRPGGDTQLPQDAADMRLHRPPAKDQDGSDLGIGATFRNQLDYFALAPRQSTIYLLCRSKLGRGTRLGEEPPGLVEERLSNAFIDNTHCELIEEHLRCGKPCSCLGMPFLGPIEMGEREVDAPEHGAESAHMRRIPCCQQNCFGFVSSP